MKTLCASLTIMHERNADNLLLEQLLLTRAQQGEQEALRQFYDLYLPAITRLCSRLLERQADAEDAVQTTFVQAFQALPRFRRESSLKTWLYRIACNSCMDTLRQRQKAPRELPETLPAPDTIAPAAERFAVHQALRHLPAEHRAILALYYWEEMPCEDIAAVLNLSLSAVKMRLFRARHAFRRCYEE